jgi:hypothetical protein
MAAGSDDSVKEIAISVATAWAELEGPSRAIHILMSLSKSSFEPHGMPSLLYFPEPVGWVETFSAAHPELETLPHKFKDLEELRYRVGLVEPAAMDLMRASVALGAAATDATRRRWARLIGPVGKLIGGLPPRRGAWTAARVDVWGDRSGHTATTSLGVVDHFYNLASVPLALCAIELGTKRLQRPGVHAPEDALDARRFLGLLSHRGVRIARLEPHAV